MYDRPVRVTRMKIIRLTCIDEIGYKIVRVLCHSYKLFGLNDKSDDGTTLNVDLLKNGR